MEGNRHAPAGDTRTSQEILQKSSVVCAPRQGTVPVEPTIAKAYPHSKFEKVFE